MQVAGSKIDASEYLFDAQVDQTRPLCNYFGVRIDAKLLFISHFEHVTKKCGTVLKARQFSSRSQLKIYSSSNVIPIVQYGVLKFGCRSYSSLLPLFMLQKKMLKFIFFRRKSSSWSYLFLKHGTVYELPKMVLKSVCTFHFEDYCNELFKFNAKWRNTRLSELKLLDIRCCKKKVETFSIKYLAAKLYNMRMEFNFLPETWKHRKKTCVE